MKIQAEDLFDASFYKNKYRDVNGDAYRHYSTAGCEANRSPTPHLAIGWFLRNHPSASQTNILEYILKNPSNAFPNRYWKDRDWGLKQLAASATLAGRVKSLMIVGLFGSGRTMFRDLLQPHEILGPIYQEAFASAGFYANHPIICSGHATLKYESAFQLSPSDTVKTLLQPMNLGHHNIIFITRNPFDSLFTNWAWWRRMGETGVPHSEGIRSIFGGNEGLCVDIENNEDDFLRFIKHGAVSLASNKRLESSQKFLSFPEFLEESVEWLSNKTIKTLRFEDIHSDEKVLESTIRELAFPRMEICIKAQKPKSAPNNYMAILAISSRVRKLIHSILNRNSIKLISKLGYEI